MLSFLQYLIALVVASHDLPEPGQATTMPAWPAIGAVVFGLGLVAAVAGRVICAIAARDTRRAARLYDRIQSGGPIVVLALFWAVAHPFAGRMIPAALGIDDWVLVAHLVRLVPFALLLGGLRSGLHPAGRLLGVEPDSVWRSLVGEARGALLPLAPLIPLLAAWDVILFAAAATRLGAVRDVLLRLPVLQALVSLSMLFVALLVMPFVMRVAWRAYPLPEGPLRTRLEAYAARVGLRSRGFLVWPTEGAVHNAAVIGPLPRFRYVVLTDALLEDLGDDEIEAVVAHEAGHARRGHILLFFGFSGVLVLASVLPQALGAQIAAPLTALDPLVRTVLMIVVWIGVVFGWISRRFEQEADVYGIETIVDPRAAQLPSVKQPTAEALDDGTAPAAAMHPFARALERIAAETGGIDEVTGWRHFSMADRIDFVQRYVSDAAVRARYQTSIRLLRGTLLFVICGVGFLAALRLPGELLAMGRLWDSARDPAAQLLGPLQMAQEPLPPQLQAAGFLQAAGLARRAGEPDAALRWLREATARAPNEPLVLATYAEALEGAGRLRGAELAWRDLLELPNVPGALADRARDALARLAAQ